MVIPVKNIADSNKINTVQRITFKANLGDSNKTPDDSLYVLPYLKAKQYKVMQSFGGSFSHNSESSHYAIDFAMQVSDTITAGITCKVIFVKEDSKAPLSYKKIYGSS